MRPKLRVLTTATATCLPAALLFGTSSIRADCNPASSCWDLHICTALIQCFTDPGISDEIRQQCFEAILNTGYASCMANVCAAEYTGEWTPNPERCLDQFLDFLKNCSDWGKSPNSRLNCNFNPDILLTPEQRKTLTKACGDAAYWQYRMCDHLANGNDPEDFDPNANVTTIFGGAAATGEFEPAAGMNHAGWLHVPQVEGDDVEIDSARLHALLWDEQAGWSWSVVGEYGTADDGMVSVDFDLSSVDSSSWINALQLVIEWRSEGESVTATPVRLGIADSNSAADFNRDSTVTIADLVAFLDAYMAEAPRADFNSDGVIDAHDLSAFIAAFDAK